MARNIAVCCSAVARDSDDVALTSYRSLITQSGRPIMSAGTAGGYARAIRVPTGIFVIVKPPSGRWLRDDDNLTLGSSLWAAALRLLDTTSNVGPVSWATRVAAARAIVIASRAVSPIRISKSPIAFSADFK